MIDPSARHPTTTPPDGQPRPRRSRPVFLAILGLTIVAGLASRSFSGFVPPFLAEHSGDALWTLAVYLLLALFRPRARCHLVAACALGISFLVEFSQLLDWPWLVAARAGRLGSLVLGHGFLAIDLLRYTIGAALGIAIDLAVTRPKTPADHHEP